MANVRNSRLGLNRVVDPLLTGLITGYSNEEFIGDKLFPIIPVVTESGKFPYFGKENFKIYDDKRALGGASNQMKGSYAGLKTYNLEEHDLEIAMDYREIKEDIFDLQKRNTFAVNEGIALGLEKAQADLAQALTSYPEGSKTSLTTKLSNADQDPITVINAAKSAMRTKIGKYPTRMIMGAVVFETLINHPKLIDKIKYSQAGIIDMTWLAKLFDISEIYVGKAQYTTDGSTFTDIWTDNIILAYMPPNAAGKANKYNPSFGYTFRLANFPNIDTYDENGGKVTNIRCTDIYEVNIVGSDAAYLINDCL